METIAETFWWTKEICEFIENNNLQIDKTKIDKIILKEQNLLREVLIYFKNSNEKKKEYFIHYKFNDFISTTCYNFISQHIDYDRLASFILFYKWNKQYISFYSFIKFIISINIDVRDVIVQFIHKNITLIQAMIKPENNFLLDYIGLKTLEHNYLIKSNDETIESPQYFFMRTAIGIHVHNDKFLTDENVNDKLLNIIEETYYALSSKEYIHATPTLFNAISNTNQMSSCFLLPIESDSVEGIFQTLKDCALISKYSGGIGLSVQNIRCRNSMINKNYKSNGLSPLLKVYDSMSQYTFQGNMKRKCSLAVYLEPWHGDIMEFLQCKRNSGFSEDFKCRNLFLSLWISDLFMKRVQNDEMWSLMCTSVCKGLDDTYGEEFEKLYKHYENKEMFIKQIRARKLWNEIIKCQLETGVPYILFKDTCNKLSNQNNLGVIKCSNLCSEIIQYSDKNNIASCNLASISLPQFAIKREENYYFDFEKFQKVIRLIVNNLNVIIDNNYYILEKIKTNNLDNRPLGIGVQGLADLFLKLNLSFIDAEAKYLNCQIFECLYFTALHESMLLAKQNKPYKNFYTSLLSKGIFHFENNNVSFSVDYELKYDWKKLKEDIKNYGTRNSLLIAVMPTATTSQILGNNESIEPYNYNIYLKRLQSGEFLTINKHLFNYLNDANLWSKQLFNDIIKNDGSIEFLKQKYNLPEKFYNMFKTCWEISQKHVIDMSSDRNKFVDQSQSLNLYIREPTINKISSMLFYAWERNLKTGMYYLRTRNAISLSELNNTCEVCTA
jgi:ribonucleoside-diphosphate reductase alpha subunit